MTLQVRLRPGASKDELLAIEGAELEAVRQALS